MGKVNKIIVNNRMLLRTIWLHNRPNALWQQQLKNTILAKEKTLCPLLLRTQKLFPAACPIPKQLNQHAYTTKVLFRNINDSLCYAFGIETTFVMEFFE